MNKQCLKMLRKNFSNSNKKKLKNKQDNKMRHKGVRLKKSRLRNTTKIELPKLRNSKKQKTHSLSLINSVLLIV